MFGIVGSFPLRNVQGMGRPRPLSGTGVGITTNGGVTFSLFDAGVYTEPRYGAFPSDDVWYITCGASYPAALTNNQARFPVPFPASRVLTHSRSDLASLTTLAICHGYSKRAARTIIGQPVMCPSRTTPPKSPRLTCMLVFVCSTNGTI